LQLTDTVDFAMHAFTDMDVRLAGSFDLDAYTADSFAMAITSIAAVPLLIDPHDIVCYSSGCS